MKQICRLLIVVSFWLNVVSAAAQTVSSPVPNLMLRVVRVTPDWMPFASTDGWTQAVILKESAVLKFYEVAIWEETSSVHLYELPNYYDPMYGHGSGITDEQKIAYREQFLISKYTGMPDAWSDERSTFLKSAFMDIASYLVNQHPTSEHHLMYNGHGGPGGALFGAQLHKDHANQFLNFWLQSLGKPLGVIDMGGPCNKGSFADLDNFSEYANYYIASDLPNGGYTMDDWTREKYDETNPETQYHNLFAANESLEGVLIGRIDLKRKGYEYSRNNMIANQVAQGNYLYSCAAFRRFSLDFKAFLGRTGIDYSMFDDLYRYMIDNNAAPTLIEQFNQVFVHEANNKDFFEWSIVSNGLLMPNPVDIPTPHQIRIVSGDDQQGLPGTALDKPFIVEVRDGSGEPLPGVQVTFSVSGGGGTLSATSVTTNTNGRAESRLTLGSMPGANTVRVTVEGNTQAVAELTIVSAARMPTFTLLIPRGTHGIHIPLNVSQINGEDAAIDTVGDLFDALGDAVNLIISLDGNSGNWLSYIGDVSAGSAADAEINDGTGLIVVMSRAATLELAGDALGTNGVSQINIDVGNNLVGVPLNPPHDMMISDLLLLESVAAIAVSKARGNGFYTITAAGQDGDGLIKGGVAYLVIAAAAGNIPIVGSAWENEDGSR